MTAFHGDKAKKKQDKNLWIQKYVLSFINLPIFDLGTNALLHPGPIILLSKYNTHNLHHVENSATVDLNTFLYVRQIHKNNNSIWHSDTVIVLKHRGRLP